MIMPYLTFMGNCEEAFNWYMEIFGGQFVHLSKYGEDVGALSGKVTHAQLALEDGSVISGGDTDQPQEKASGVLIQNHMSQEKLAYNAFEALAQGGLILGPLASNPPPDDGGISGCVQDRYGFTWIISAQKDAK